MPTKYRHTDKHLRLVMTLIALFCIRQSRAHKISTAVCQKIDLDLWPWPQRLTLTLKEGNSDVKNTIFGIWPWLLTFDLDLQSQPSQGQGQPIINVVGQMILAVRGQMDGGMDRQRDRRYQVHYLPHVTVNNKYLLCGNWLSSVCERVPWMRFWKDSVECLRIVFPHKRILGTFNQ